MKLRRSAGGTLPQAPPIRDQRAPSHPLRRGRMRDPGRGIAFRDPGYTRVILISGPSPRRGPGWGPLSMDGVVSEVDTWSNWRFVCLLEAGRPVKAATRR